MHASKPCKYWSATIPEDKFQPSSELHPRIRGIMGQLETAPTTGTKHWQLFVVCYKNITLGVLKGLLGGTAHLELTRSDAIRSYVWKDDTAVSGTRFSYGECKPFRRNEPTDWASVRSNVCLGRWNLIPDDIYIRYYGNLQRIFAAHCTPVSIIRTVHVFWGPTRTGKTRRAYDEAGSDAYWKISSNKWWDGYRGHCNYQGQSHVIIDEFTGSIGIEHLLRWFDRYPVYLEIKGSIYPSMFTTLWVTSNLSPDAWYPTATKEQLDALRARLTVTHFNENLI